ncbi:hypothetical protein GCM10027294_53450 [Marinactinospora endophytica]
MLDRIPVSYAVVTPAGAISFRRSTPRTLIRTIYDQVTIGDNESGYDYLGRAPDIAAYYAAPYYPDVLPVNVVANRMIGHLDPVGGLGQCHGDVAFVGTGGPTAWGGLSATSLRRLAAVYRDAANAAAAAGARLDIATPLTFVPVPAVMEAVPEIPEEEEEPEFWDERLERMRPPGPDPAR